MTRHELGTVCVQGGWRPKNGEPCQLIGIGKTLLERKLSGVFEHRVVRRSSMLFRGCDDVFRIPHSRHTTIDEEAVRAQCRRIGSLTINGNGAEIRGCRCSPCHGQ